MDEIPEKPKTYWKALLGYGLAAIAVAIFFWGNHAIEAYKARSEASQEWPTVEGMIIESRAEKRVSQDSDGDTSISYVAIITYEYFVDDIRYTSGQLGWEDYLYRDTMAEAQRLADSYPTGMTVEVHYDPEEPEFALLNTMLPERPNDVGISYFIGSGAILAIAATLIYSYTGTLLRIPGGAIIVGGLILFLGGAGLTMLNVRFSVLIGFGFISFAVGGIVRNRR